MAKSSKIEVDKKSISIIEQNSEDYICLMDMVRGEGGEDPPRCSLCLRELGVGLQNTLLSFPICNWKWTELQMIHGFQTF